MWVPGYWAYGDEGYYWVPGAWVPSPYVGALWTPGYWGWGGGLYAWHAGYWGPHVGYYGGVNYGYGYGGIGFAGGMWRGGFFAYNTAVMHVGVGGGWGNRTYVDQTIVNRTTIINNNHVSYNGGPGGINHQPTPDERVAEHEQHTAPTALQTQHEDTFRNDHTAYAKFNGGHPQNAALARPLGGENHGNMQGNERPAYRSEVAPHNGGGGNPPHPNSASAPHSNPHPESKPSPQGHPKQEKEHKE
jgi:hypothetical protein